MKNSTRKEAIMSSNVETKSSEAELNLGQRAREKIKSWALSTTTHGVQKFTKAQKSHTRVFWIIFIFMALGLCSYVVVNNIIQFMKYDVTTKIRIVDQQSVIFPVISICNMNPLVTPSAGRYIKEYFLEKSDF